MPTNVTSPGSAPGWEDVPSTSRYEIVPAIFDRVLVADVFPSTKYSMLIF
jgi:hypothetical protein